MAEYTQENRILSFTSPLGADTLLAVRFTGTEEVSELFDYQVDLYADPQRTIDPSTLIGKRVTLSLQVTDSGMQRYFNGIVASLDSLGGDSFFHNYRVRMVPTLWLLSLNKQTRVFQDKSVLDILREVLAPYSIVPRIETQAVYLPLEYCTQYRETDLDFIARILQQQGVFFYFTHVQADHTMIVSDAASLLSGCQVSSEFRYGAHIEEELSFYDPVVYKFVSRSQLISGEHTSWDYRFIPYTVAHASPPTAHGSTPMSENAHEVYDYADAASSYFKTEGGDARVPQMQTKLQQVMNEAAEAQSVRCNGESTASTMQAGASFTLSEYPQPEKNMKYLLTRVEHSAEQRPGYRAADAAGLGVPYTNRFEANPFTQPFRKAHAPAKPRVNGVVTGQVVTPPGDDAYLDKYGRVCVQFWWDRNRPPETPDKTLLRVSQQWAGRGWGTYFWPRVGDEVLIDFMDGDPDAPIVVGSVYNGVNLPKYDPRSQYTRSGILTRSSRGGRAANANELRFDDLEGREQVFINAERDYDLHVEHDAHALIGHEEHRTVTEDQYHSVGGAAVLRVQGNRAVQVEGISSETVMGARSEKVAGMYSLEVAEVQASKTGGLHSITAGEEIDLNAGVRIVLEAVGSICLRAAECAITIDPSGVCIQGPLRFGIAECLPAAPVPPTVLGTPVTNPQWPGDDPRA